MTRGDSDADRHHALIAGGGSGGHVFPGVALAAELARGGWSVSFVGRAASFEERLASGAGLTFHALPAAPVLGASLGRKARSLAITLRGALAGRRLVRHTRADVVIGLGGYVSVPAVVGGRLAGRPVLLFEPNAAAGTANRWLSRLADEAAAAYESTTSAFHCRSTVTGTPVRPEFFAQPREPRRPPLVLVLGGSQGARQLNEVVPAALGRMADPGEAPRVLHQCGEANVEATRRAYEAAAPRLASLEVAPFLDDVASALGRASLVISRAGAVTLAEICAVGRAAVLVPLSIAAAHQSANAATLVAAGAARVVSGGDDLVDALGTLLAELLAAPETLAEMGRSSRALARPDAAAALAGRVTALVEAA